MVNLLCNLSISQVVQKLPLLFSFEFSGTIWKTLTDSNQKRLIVEVRDELAFKTVYSVIDLENSTMLKESISFSESWWIAPVAFDNELIFVETYLNKGGNPDRKNLIAYDINTDSIRWERAMFSFCGFAKNRIAGYAYDVELKKVLIDPASGTVEQLEWHLDEPMNTTGALLYDEGNSHFRIIASYIYDRTGKDAVRGIEYQEMTEHTIMSFYVTENERLANYLLIITNDGVVVYFDRIANALTGIGKDTFFTLADCVFFVKNKSELVSYKLV